MIFSVYYSGMGSYPTGIALMMAGVAAGSVLPFLVLRYRQRRLEERIKDLTRYLERVQYLAANSEEPASFEGEGLLFDTAEDAFSGLRDEIYKTVTTLYQTRDDALSAKKNFAENLSNIAHQLKTPITAISLSAQMMKEYPDADYADRIKQQLGRLTHLEEALLLLSRIDAGSLVLRRTDVDVYTLLMLASDNLQEMSAQQGVGFEIPQEGEVNIFVDSEWTMEAVMNLLKNCLEHTPAGGRVHCSYEKNPLYVQIRIWDEGQGFAKEDMPRLFDRFYRGQSSGKAEGIGIGLSLAKAIIEMQNGVISAFNLPSGSACFEIRIYSH